MNIRNRVVKIIEVPANQLRPNPMNWRSHSDHQRNAFRGVLAEIGYAGAQLCRQLFDGSYELIDGHLRAEEMGDQLVPVIVTDLTDEEAKKLLVVYDPIGDLAGTDSLKLSQLLDEINAESPALLQLFDDLAAQADVAAQLAERIGPAASESFDDDDHDLENETSLIDSAATRTPQLRVRVTAFDGQPLTEADQAALIDLLKREGYTASRYTASPVAAGGQPPQTE